MFICSTHTHRNCDHNMESETFIKPPIYSRYNAANTELRMHIAIFLQHPSTQCSAHIIWECRLSKHLSCLCDFHIFYPFCVGPNGIGYMWQTDSTKLLQILLSGKFTEF